MSDTLSTSDLRANPDRLRSLTRDALRQLWRETFGDSPPPSISQPLMRRYLAFELQLQASGGWPKALKAELDQHLSGKRRKHAPVPEAGARLLREWNGTTHVVEITEVGYRWNGEDWRSLSAIARAITGAHWSGPRFFGLAKGEAASKRRAP